MAATLIDVPESGIVYVVSGVGSALNRGWGGVMLSHWRERHRSAKEIMTALQENLPTVEGIAATAFLPAPLPGSVGGFPVQFVLSSPDKHESVHASMEKIKAAARASGYFAFVDSDLTFPGRQCWSA